MIVHKFINKEIYLLESDEHREFDGDPQVRIRLIYNNSSSKREITDVHKYIKIMGIDIDSFEELETKDIPNWVKLDIIKNGS